ncbi:hypothetical protein KR044_006518, partial [Drosophila immigrans]
LTNAVCESHNQSWISINKCRLRAIARNKIAFYFNATFLHPANNIFLDTQILKKASGFKPWLVKYRLDCCRFVKKSYNPVAIIIYNLYSKFSNINHTCPFVVSFIVKYSAILSVIFCVFQGDQILDGFYLRPEILQGLPLPSGDYLLEMIWLFDKKPQFVTNVYFQFTE